jgi:hypothetical protein
VGDCGRIICLANSFSNKVTRRSGRNPRQRGGTIRVDAGFLIEKIIEGIRHSVEYIRTIEDDNVRQRVMSVFVFAIQSTLVLCASFAGIATIGAIFVTGDGLTRTKELDGEEIGEEDVAETIARVVDRRLSSLSTREGN